MTKSILELDKPSLQAVIETNAWPDDMTLKGAEIRSDFTEILTLSKEPARCAKYLLSKFVDETPKVSLPRGYVPTIPLEMRERKIIAEERRIERMRDIRVEMKVQNELLKKVLDLLNAMSTRHRRSES